MTIALSILAISSGIYVIFMIISILGLFKKASHSTDSQKFIKSFSIIIPYRNEGDRIQALQNQLIQSLSSFTQYEVLWINDHSEDNAQPHASPNHKNLNLPNQVIGKKSAIKFGIDQAQFDHMICLDADIDLHPHFFDQLVTYWTNQVHICPVIVKPKGLWSSLWALESYALCGITVGMARTQHAVMNNGAAWAFNKSDWQSLNIRQLSHPSGDDIFALEAFKKEGYSFSSNLSKESVVKVDVPDTLRSFFKQRIRWAGKSAKIRDTGMLIFGTATFTMYLSMIACLILSIFHSFSEAFIGILTIKYIIDFSLLFLVSIKAGLPPLLWAFPLLSVIYPFYTVLIALISLFYQAKWKGR